MNLGEIIEELQEIDNAAIVDGKSRHYLESAQRDGSSLVEIWGNREGLVYLALSCLRLADKGIDGSHQHFDEAGMVDKAGVDFQIGLAKPDWPPKNGT